MFLVLDGCRTEDNVHEPHQDTCRRDVQDTRHDGSTDEQEHEKIAVTGQFQEGRQLRVQLVEMQPQIVGGAREEVDVDTEQVVRDLYIEKEKQIENIECHDFQQKNTKQT